MPLIQRVAEATTMTGIPASPKSKTRTQIGTTGTKGIRLSKAKNLAVVPGSPAETKILLPPGCSGEATQTTNRMIGAGEAMATPPHLRTGRTRSPRTSPFTTPPDHMTPRRDLGIAVGLFHGLQAHRFLSPGAQSQTRGPKWQSFWPLAPIC